MSERFSAPTLRALTEAGWQPGRSVAGPTAEAIARACEHIGREGQRHRPFPAAERALDEFGGLTVDPTGDGRDLLPRPFALDPTMAAASTETLADVGAVLGVALFPIGVEGDRDALLAMDEGGRVFSIDHTGEWFLGNDLDAAIESLVRGLAPARVHDDGTIHPAGG